MSTISKSIVNTIEFHIDDSFFVELYKRRLRTYKVSFATVPIRATLKANILYITDSSFNNTSNPNGLLACFNTRSEYSSHDDSELAKSIPSLNIELDFAKNDLKHYAEDFTKFLIFTYIDLSGLICHYRIALLRNFTIFDQNLTEGKILRFDSKTLPEFENFYFITENLELESVGSKLPVDYNAIAILSETEEVDKISLQLANLLSHLYNKFNSNELTIHFINKTTSNSVKLKIEYSEKWLVAFNLFDGKISLNKPEIDVRDLVSNLHFELALWRIIPELNLSKFENLSVTILGMGTLGCSVSLQLINWGIRNLTLVDSGRVSHTNIARQLLYSTVDAENRRLKVEAANEYLKNLSPNINIKTYNLDIPVLGNSVYLNDMKKLEKNVKLLSDIVYSNDVVFMVTDTRESRWLPSLLVSKRNREEWPDGKGVLGVVASLGFDSCLVTRQSFGKFSCACYFCGDFTAGSNGADNRLNDELCTVTRPGIAPICASLAVELVASLTQSEIGFESEHATDSLATSCLGAVPQTLRFNLSNMMTSAYHNEANERCICCSKTIIDAFNEDNLEFLKHAIAKPDLLTVLTELDNLQTDDVIIL